MFGKGLIKGLKITAEAAFDKNVTEEYPEVRPELPSRWRGRLTLDRENCIACGSCAMSCPNNALDFAFEVDENKKRKIKKLELDAVRCMSCGLCVEACPKKCLRFSKKYETAVTNKYFLKEDLIGNGFASEDLSSWGQE